LARSREISKIFSADTNIVTATELNSAISQIDLSSTIVTASNAAVSALVNGAPQALDTLNELSTALQNDPNFYNTVSNIYLSKSNASSTYLAQSDATSSYALKSFVGAQLIASTTTVTSNTSLILDGCFTNTYNKYLVNIEIISAGASGDGSNETGFRFRSSGSDYSSSTYTWRRYRHYSGHANNELENGTTAQATLMPYNRLDRGLMASLLIYYPFQARPTYFVADGVAYHPSNDFTFPNTLYGGVTANNQFDGIKYYTISGTNNTYTTAKMTVYGLL
jgi:hypothetical protein